VGLSKTAKTTVKILRSGDDLTKRQRLIFIILLGLSMTLMPYTIDPILAAFPRIGETFGATDSQVQLSLMAVTLGFALGQLITGPLSDSLGRKRPMLFAVGIWFLAEFATMISPTIEGFYAARFLASFAAASATVVASAIIRDLYKEAKMMQFLSRVYLVQGMSPVLGPIIGSQLLPFMSWQSIVFIFGIYGLVTFVGLRIFLVETLHSEDRRAKGFNGILGRFRAVLHDRVYVGLVIFSALQTISLFAYLNLVPFIFQDGFKIGVSEFGVFFALNSLISVIGTQVGGRLAVRFRSNWVLFSHIVLASLSGVALVVAAMLHAEFGVVTALFAFFTFNFGATYTPLISIALANHGEEAGTAASLLGVVNFVSASLAGPLYAVIDHKTSAGAGAIIAIAYALGALSLLLVSRVRTIPPLKN
jgi:DHA1 family bicyclomycin/chloramphenicol resistance-like MFS transporter